MLEFSLLGPVFLVFSILELVIAATDFGINDGVLIIWLARLWCGVSEGSWFWGVLDISPSWAVYSSYYTYCISMEIIYCGIGKLFVIMVFAVGFSVSRVGFCTNQLVCVQLFSGQ